MKDYGNSPFLNKCKTKHLQVYQQQQYSQMEADNFKPAVPGWKSLADSPYAAPKRKEK